MGAYYEVIGQDTKTGEMFSINPIETKLSLMKLMEHSYVGNSFVNAVLLHLLDNPVKLGWVCDYFEEDDEFNWDNKLAKELRLPYTEKSLAKVLKERFGNKDVFIVNHSKNMYIDMKKYEELCKKDPKIFADEDYIIHPLPLLANSNYSEMGGGDYYAEIPVRSWWFKDEISVTTDPEKVSKSIDITEMSLIPSDKLENPDLYDKKLDFYIEKLEEAVKKIKSINKSADISFVVTNLVRQIKNRNDEKHRKKAKDTER